MAGSSFLYRWFSIGAIPEPILQTLENEGIVVMDQGIYATMKSRKFSAPGRNSRRRSEMFVGSLAVTRKRIVAIAFGRKVLNIPFDNDQLQALHWKRLSADRLGLTFDSGDFHSDWKGRLSFSFSTERCPAFIAALEERGVRCD